MKYDIIGDHIIWTNVGFGNSVAIDLVETVYIVDSMNNWKLSGEWRQVVGEYLKKPVCGLILTHHHPDHVFGNQSFADVPIIPSVDIRTMMNGFNTEYWENIDLEERNEWENEGYGIKDFNFTYPTIYQIYFKRILKII
ncbi:MAG: MBL fold metallo-hydrolase [Candidatus Heimdallarchaeaceae archaeon]